MINIIKYHLYLLQLENYQYFRFLKVLVKRGFFPPKTGSRHSLVWTTKAKLLMMISFGLHLGLVLTIGLIFGMEKNLYGCLVMILIFMILSLDYYVWFGGALILIYPIDGLVKQMVVKKAVNKLNKMKNLKVIAIAGSYGKTTMKEVLKSVLQEEFETLAVPDSVNTPVGIARFIDQRVNRDTQVLILEMGEYYEGDIHGLCEMFKPNIGVMTGINESHLERLGDIGATIRTIFELASGIDKEGFLVLNADDSRIKENYKKFTNGQELVFYSSEGSDLTGYRVKNQQFLTDELVNRFELDTGADHLGKFESKILGEYIIGTVGAAAMVGLRLGMNRDKIEKGVKNISPVKHRLEPIFNREQDILVIDDSYNGNPDGVREAIKLLAKFKDRRKVYLTPGLVETGKKAKEIHLEIGKQLGKTADLVILIENSVTPSIIEGLRLVDFDSKNVIKFASAKEAHESLGSILKRHDVILFQNDWGDQYF